MANVSSKFYLKIRVETLASDIGDAIYQAQQVKAEGGIDITEDLGRLFEKVVEYQKTLSGK